MFTEARAVGRQNLRGHLQRHASKGQEPDLGHRPSCSIRKHRKPLLVDLAQRELCRRCQQSPTLTGDFISVESKGLTEAVCLSEINWAGREDIEWVGRTAW